MRTPEAITARRMAMIEDAIMNGRGYGYLSGRWNLTTVSAREWCERHVSEDDRKLLAQNGKLAVHKDRPSLVDRLAMIALCRRDGWSDARIARAMGLTAPGLSQWLKRNAPDGLADALSDFQDDEAEAA